MLHEAIFLATCNATMTTEKHCKLQRGCHTFTIFVRNLQRTRWKLLSSNLAQAKDALWLAHFNKIALQVTIDMSHAATCLATLRKEKDSSTFPVTCNVTFCCIAGCENGVLHVQFFSQLATQRLLRCKLQEKLRRVTWALGGHSNLSVRDHWPRTGHFKRGRDNFRLHSLECGASVQHIITSRVTKSTAGIRRVAKLDFISATTVATVARFYQTKTEKKPIHTVLGPSFLNLTISHFV